MIIIQDVSERYFTLNGIQYAKIYQPLKQGVEAIGIYNVNDTSQQLISSTSFDEYEINGTVYTSQALTIAALLPVVYLEEAYFDYTVNNYTGDQVVNNFENNPDEEDLTEVSNYLRFKDRQETVEGSEGYKIIRSGFDFGAIPLDYKNSIWELRYSFDIQGGVLSLPEGVTLFFNGGIIKNGAIVGNNTKIISGRKKAFDSSVVFSGSFVSDVFYPEWFGAKADGVSIDTYSIQKALDYGKTVEFQKGKTYLIDSDLKFNSNQKIEGNGAKIITQTSVKYMMRNKLIDQTGNNGGSNIVIKDLIFDGQNNSLDIGGIGIAHTFNCEIIGCQFINFIVSGGLHAIDAPANTLLTIKDCLVFGYEGATAFQIDRSSSGSMPVLTTPVLNEDNTPSRRVLIESNRFVNCNISAIHLHKKGHSDIVVKSNRFQECTNAINDDIGSTYRSNGRTKGIVICGNTINNKTIPAYYGNAIVLDYVEDVVISENVINNEYAGILVLINGGGSERNLNVNISNNVVFSDQRDAIVIENATKASIIGNQITKFGEDTFTRRAIRVYNSIQASVVANNISSVTSTGKNGIEIVDCVKYVVSGNTIEKCLIAIYVDSTNITGMEAGVIKGNIIAGAASNGIKSLGSPIGLTVCNNNLFSTDIYAHNIRIEGASYVSVVGNVLHGVRSSLAGISLSSCKNGAVNGNTVHSEGSSSDGIGVTGSGNGAFSIVGNYVEGFNNGIAVYFSADNGVVVGNTIRNCTNDTDLGVGVVVSNNDSI